MKIRLHLLSNLLTDGRRCQYEDTSNVTGRHRGPKQKLGAACYRAPSIKRTSCCDAFSLSHVETRAFSALCMYSTFGHHLHPLGYLCANFVSFTTSIAELARGERSLTHSVTQPAYLILMPRETKLSLRIGVGNTYSRLINSRDQYITVSRFRQHQQTWTTMNPHDGLRGVARRRSVRGLTSASALTGSNVRCRSTAAGATRLCARRAS